MSVEKQMEHCPLTFDVVYAGEVCSQATATNSIYRLGTTTGDGPVVTDMEMAVYMAATNVCAAFSGKVHDNLSY